MNDTAESGARPALTLEWLEAQYRLHATVLVRLAVLLTRDRATAEDAATLSAQLSASGRPPHPGGT